VLRARRRRRRGAGARRRHRRVLVAHAAPHTRTERHRRRAQGLHPAVRARRRDDPSTAIRMPARRQAGAAATIRERQFAVLRGGSRVEARG
jgi:hypothetical protein